jgi:hypothetical protein
MVLTSHGGTASEDDLVDTIGTVLDVSPSSVSPSRVTRSLGEVLPDVA